MQNFVRLAQLTTIFGLSESTILRRTASGLLPPPVRLARRACGWPAGEIDVVTAALVASSSDPQLRKLVRSLIAARKRPTRSATAAKAA
jgi:predicted DNA-binding transcriptional regulator AlpA